MSRTIVWAACGAVSGFAAGFVPVTLLSDAAARAAGVPSYDGWAILLALPAVPILFAALAARFAQGGSPEWGVRMSLVVGSPALALLVTAALYVVWDPAFALLPLPAWITGPQEKQVFAAALLAHSLLAAAGSAAGGLLSRGSVPGRIGRAVVAAGFGFYGYWGVLLAIRSA